jgi:hypothetical protein
MYRSMDELTTHCRHAHLRWVIAAVAWDVLDQSVVAHRRKGHGQSFDGFIARWI